MSNEAAAGRDVIYSRPVDERTVATRAGDLVRAWRVGGVSPWSSGERLHRAHQALRMLLRSVANPQVAVWSHLLRTRVQPELPMAGQGVAGDVQRTHHAGVLAEGVYENRLYVSLVYRPAASEPESWAARLMPGRKTAAPLSVDARAALMQASIAVESALSGHGGLEALGEYERGGGRFSSLHEFLSELVTGDWQRRSARPGVSLAQAWGTSRPLIGREVLELRGAAGGRLVAALGFTDYPHHAAKAEGGQDVEYWMEAGHLNTLLAAPCELRVSQSFEFVQKDAARSRTERQADQIERAGSQSASSQASNASASAAGGADTFGWHDMAVFVMVDAPLTAEAKAREAAVVDLTRKVGEVAQRLRDREASVARHSWGLYDVWCGQQPGAFGARPRKTWLTAENFACLAPLHGFGQGNPKGGKWGPAPVAFRGVAGVPYWFDLLVSDVGHAFVAGMTESGKTALLARLLAAYRLRGVRQLLIDNERANELAVRAFGGDYRNLRAGEPTGFAPLRRPITDGNVLHAVWLLQGLCNAAGDSLNAEQVEELARAVRGVYRDTVPMEDRRPSSLLEYLDTSSRERGGEVARRLEPWMRGGLLDWVFDGPARDVDWSCGLVGFDLTDLMGLEHVRTPAFAHLLHLIDSQLDGRPLILHMDEGQEFYGDATMGGLVQAAHDKWRKLQAAIVTYTTDPKNALASPVGHTIAAQCPTKILFPNAAASRAVYGQGSEGGREGLGLDDAVVAMVQAADATRRELVVVQGKRAELVRFDMGHAPDLLTIMSSNEVTVRLAERVRADVGDDPAVWVPVLQARWREIKGKL